MINKLRVTTSYNDIMISSLISRLIILLFGTLYPAYASYKAVRNKNVKEYVKWMMYWIVFALFTSIETFSDVILAWLPFYYEIKIIFVIWLLSPVTKGASVLYRKFVHPQLSKREKDIDEYISKASDRGYSTLLTLGTKGVSYATNVVLKTAMTGQSKLVDHIKRSYSLSDLAGAGTGTSGEDLQLVDSEDELDNRLLEDNRELEKRRALGFQREAHGTKEYRDENKDRPKMRKSQTDDGLYTLSEEDSYSSPEHKAAGVKIVTRPTRSTRSNNAYSHTEVYHYGTLRRKTPSTRPSLYRY